MAVEALDEVGRPGDVVDLAVPEAPAVPSGHAVVMDAALECFGRWGVAKSTLEDIGREAGLSRATVYRLFPGGKAALVESVAARELDRLVTVLRSEMAAAEDLESAVVVALVGASQFLANHRALNYLIEHERDALLPFIAFDRLEPALLVARVGLAPVLSRFVQRDLAEEIVEWGTRMVLSLVFTPGSVDPTDEASVRSFVSTFLAPGLLRSTGVQRPPT